VPAGARWGGTPAKPVKQWFREMLLVERMAARDNGGPAAAPADQ
jgi:UDP-3-O-[3-hydroxymyristoyl] glucosamine N-acyltransferase